MKIIGNRFRNPEFSVDYTSANIRTCKKQVIEIRSHSEEETEEDEFLNSSPEIEYTQCEGLVLRSRMLGLDWLGFTVYDSADMRERERERGGNGLFENWE